MPKGEPKPMNVLFILADDLGYSDTTLYGTTWFYETPNIQKLARRGMLLRNAYTASPVCSATRASILTGQEPGRLGLTGAGAHLVAERTKSRFRTVEEIAARPRHRFKKATVPFAATRVASDVDNLAKVLRREGYATGHFGKWHLGAEPYSPLESGFDVDIPHWSGAGGGDSYLAPWSFPDELKFKPRKPGEHLEDRMADEAIAFMEAHRDEPFFLNYWAFSVHSPFNADPAVVAKYAKRAHSGNAQRSPVYAAMVEHFDDAVGKLLAALDRLGLAENTIVVFYSDNGGSTYDRIDGAPVTSNAPLRGGKGQIFEGGTHVPGAVVWPGRIDAQSRSDALVSSTDWFPTLLDMLGLEPPEGHILDGVSQVPALLSRGTPRESIFCFLPHYFPLPGTVPATSVRRGKWKLIRFYNDGPELKDRFELYDLDADPGEQQNVAAEHPARVSELNARITRFLAEIGALVPRKNEGYTPP